MGIIRTQLYSMPFHVIKDEETIIPGEALIGMAVLKWSTIDFPESLLKFKHKMNNGKDSIQICFEDNEEPSTETTSNMTQ